MSRTGLRRWLRQAAVVGATLATVAVVQLAGATRIAPDDFFSVPLVAGDRSPVLALAALPTGRVEPPDEPPLTTAAPAAPPPTSPTGAATPAPVDPPMTPAPTAVRAAPALGFATLPFPPGWASAPSFEVADAAVPAVTLYQSPDAPFPDGRRLTNPTAEGSPLVFLVREDRGAWLLVQIPRRPNGAVAWVRREDVTIRRVPDHLVVQLGARTLTVFQGAGVVRRVTVAVGAPRDPTPLGDFYVDAARRLVPPDPAYGDGELSLSGFSNVLRSFAGGVGQIAIHGTGRPDLVGEAVSHGCLRVTQEDLLALLDQVETGTPVSITP